MTKKQTKKQTTQEVQPDFSTYLSVKNLAVRITQENEKIKVKIDGLDKIESYDDLMTLQSILETAIENLDNHFIVDDICCENCCGDCE